MHDFPVRSRLRATLSSLNARRKLARGQRERERAVREALERPEAPSPARIRQALAMLGPRETGIPLVRLGPDTDGGYLVPDDLEGITALFSPGVSEETGFDHEIAGRGIECFLADASVECPANLLPNMHFRPAFLGPQDDGTFISLESWLADCPPEEGDLMLQMDIEGAEYDVLESVPETILSRFRIILIELHDFRQLVDPAWFDRFTRVLERLAATHVTCHMHVNNCGGSFHLKDMVLPEVIELTLLRRDRATPHGQPSPVPHPLDRPNVAKLPEIRCSRFWTSD